MEQIVTYLVMVKKCKAKDSELVATLLCLGNDSKDCSMDNMKKTGLNGCLWIHFDYEAIAVDNILDIHKYLKQKNGIV